MNQNKYYRIYIVCSPRTDKCLIGYTSQYLTKKKYDLKRFHNLTNTQVVNTPETPNELLKLGDIEVILLAKFKYDDFQNMYIKYKQFCIGAGDLLIKTTEQKRIEVEFNNH